MKKIIFNSSMPRSGSELLQVLLHQNPKIYGSATSPLLEYLYGARANTSVTEFQSQQQNLMFGAFGGFCRGGVSDFMEEMTDRPIYCDKSRGWLVNYMWAEKILGEEPKMIVMVRDLRGIIGSMENAYQKKIDSAEASNLPAQLNRRVGHWLDLNFQHNSNNPNVGSAPVGLALNRISGAFQDGTADKVLFVKFEDLCSKPQETMNKIYKYIGEEPFEHDFQNIKKEVIEDCTPYGIFGDHNIKPSIKPAGEQWKNLLPNEISDAIRKEFDWYFEKLGY